MYCCLCLSALQLGIIKIIQNNCDIGIIEIISAIGIIEIISKILPEHQALVTERAGGALVTDELLHAG